MEILIDSQAVVDVEVTTATSEGDTYLVLDIEATFDLLTAWRDLDPKRRAFSWSGDGTHESVMIAWYSDAAGLTYELVPPFWDGVGEWDGHSLAGIQSALPTGMLEWEER